LNFINTSPQGNAKLAVRKELAHTMIQRAMKLQQALMMMKRNEVVMRQQSCRQLSLSKLEQLRLEDHDFDTLGFLEELLSPFADAQRCLEGGKYVNISLVVLVIKKLQSALIGAYMLLWNMNNNFRE
jgi:hypothetical protein